MSLPIETFWLALISLQIAVNTVTPCDNVLISEVNAATPEAIEKTEFIELWNSGNCKAEMDGCEVAQYSGGKSKTIPVLQESWNLTNFCIPGNGYFIIGGKKITNPDVHVSRPFVQNANKGTDAVTLYKGFQDTSAYIVNNNLVDVMFYDKSPESPNTEAFETPLTAPLSPIKEDKTYLEGDEGMSRCSLGSINMSAFSVRELTPRAPNTCLPDVLMRWPSPCPDTVFPSPPSSRSFQYKTQSNVKASSDVIASKEVHSLTQCCAECTMNDMCTHFSFRKGTCDLHSHCITHLVFSSDGIVGEKYYVMSATNPEWPHEALPPK